MLLADAEGSEDARQDVIRRRHPGQRVQRLQRTVQIHQDHLVRQPRLIRRRRRRQRRQRRPHRLLLPQLFSAPLSATDPAAPSLPESPLATLQFPSPVTALVRIIVAPIPPRVRLLHPTSRSSSPLTRSKSTLL